MFCVHVRICSMCVPSACECQKRAQDPWNKRYRWFWAAIRFWVLHKSKNNVLNCWAVYPIHLTSLLRCFCNNSCWRTKLQMSPLSSYLFNHLESLVLNISPAIPFFPKFASLPFGLSGFSRTLLLALGNPTIAITGNETEDSFCKASARW